MTKFLISILMLLAMWQATFSQSKHGAAWITGSTFVTRFNSNNSIRQYNIGPIQPSKSFDYGHSNICDSSGKLILISDGFNLFDSSLLPLDGGLGLSFPAFYQHYNGTGNLYDQWSMLLPLENEIYCMINTGVTNQCYDSSFTINQFPFDRLLYHKVDMKMNNGAGKVYEKMVVIDTGRFEASGMMACKHSNGKDWWLIKQGADSVRFYTYLITKDSVVHKGIQSFSYLPFEFLLQPYFQNKGQIMFNNNGTKIASVTKQRKSLYTFDFDRCTGIISNAKNHPPILGGFDINMKGVCFSPNDRFIYVAQSGRILQFDTDATDSASAWYVVAGMDTIGTQFPGYENIYPGPDGKLYIGNDDIIRRTCSVINQPNMKGAVCAWCPQCLRTDSLLSNGISQPPCMPNYNLGASSAPCWPVSINQYDNEPMSQLEVYPNPTSEKFHIKYKNPNSKKELFNSLGQLLLSTQTSEIDASHLPKGLYYLKCEGQVRKVIIE